MPIEATNCELLPTARSYREAFRGKLAPATSAIPIKRRFYQATSNRFRLPQRCQPGFQKE